MEAKTDRLYPSAPLQQDDLAKRQDKKINDINSFFITILTTLKKRLHSSKTKTTNEKRNVKNIKQ